MASLYGRKAKSVPTAPNTYRAWSSEETTRALELRQRGWSLEMIARTLGRTTAATTNHLRRMRNTKSNHLSEGENKS